MGVFKMFSSSSYEKPTIIERVVEVFKPSKNPNPENFTIKRIVKLGKYLITEINYPDCNNFEGNKVLVFDNLKLEELQSLSTIDPHFSNNKKFKSPIARFEPTEKGWNLALKLCEL